jgi:N-carbamoyl-L-amino-acid hydrolase
VDRIGTAADTLGLSWRTMPSGAGHDAQMFAPNCPSAMIFVPSQGGISHNIHEYTAPDDIANGVRLLAKVALARAGATQPEGLYA